MHALPLTLLLVVVGCGRLGFDGHGGSRGVDAADSDATGSDANDDLDAAVCPGGDGVCLPACVGSDLDCVTTCGDGRCVGNAGELCGSCADCETRAAVCGNAQCDPSEDSATCYADCGPTPWPWLAEEAALRNEVNAARTGGTTCPGDTVPRFAVALIDDPTLQAGAREYAWEIAHHQYHQLDACNGRTFVERQAPHGADGGLSHSSTTSTAAQAVAGWRSDAMLCPILMTTQRTRMSAGVALDAWRGWVLWFK